MPNNKLYFSYVLQNFHKKCILIIISDFRVKLCHVYVVLLYIFNRNFIYVQMQCVYGHNMLFIAIYS